MTQTFTPGMTAQEIYVNFGLPKHLQRHMLQVAALGQYLSQNCTEEILEYHVVWALLLHDLGNVLKFDFSAGVDLFDPEERDLETWQKYQAEIAKKYGDDVHETTIKMAKEAGAAPRTLELIQGMGRTGLKDAVETADWEQRICCYSDFRVSPSGYTTLEDRFDDIIMRYTARPVRPVKIERISRDRNSAIQLEQQLRSRLLIELDKLPEAELVHQAEVLKDFKI